ncbi:MULTISPECIES: PssD/Cps14F family polysaccharide biosynthesis glycosyltransferase [Geomicrobium]|uniref:UDP-N-acetylglucosamine:LPS N-acetylglucosamine transferase n=1 Tax=Geomicrobium sediminis TaxID=1347788 RepID=A0ABS2P7M3_9BACL|nr:MULTISPECIES: PssD/Cps14F family polysaccharide biosynthesis glycosyltransferase [Geomicrobium]MBM7631304.1 UDP-N-acetylglucosamine:LPS N-acetylglucosamine transferase [Geomicrobium sediminis]GAK07188.1 polysaccharide biosynthesis protein CpsF [Geomicrobium sp. JCM 19038]
MKRVLFISSVGGHLTQLMQLQPLMNEYESHMITEKTEVTKALKKDHPNLSFLVYGARNYPVRYLFKFSFNIIKSLVLFLKLRPEVVVTTGTHTAVPMCYIAKLFRKKVIYIESFAKTDSPTLSGRMIYPIADLFIVQWKTMLKHYPKAKYGGSIY